MRQRVWVVTIGLFAVFLLGAASPERESKGSTTISADRLEVDRKNRVAVYEGHVVAEDKGKCITILADRMDFYFDEKMEEIQRVVAVGNVRIAVREKHSSSERAEYFPKEDRALLEGSPRVWHENDTVSGSRIILYLAQDRAVAEKGEGERVVAVVYPRHSREGGGPTPPDTSRDGGRGDHREKPRISPSGCAERP